MKSINKDEFYKLTKEKNKIYVILHGYVYELSSFLLRHPGGSHILKENSSKDITTLFSAMHPYVDHEILLQGMCVGQYTEDD
eukprot:GAHX01002765.1.p1 GENE.GAHX01002765.1~~GAHX01002765.1.p1  ORF type:complete len:82 (+),score=8.37 GAHX01002765.1:108-353(+)